MIIKKAPGDIIILHRCTKHLDDMISSWDIECETEIRNYGSLFAFLPPPKNQKNQAFGNTKKCWRYHHFTNLYWKPQSYEVWFLRYRVTQTELFVILGQFCPFTPLKTQKTIWTNQNYCTNQNFEKKKKIPGDIIILHKCTKNNDHMLYCSWDMVQDDCNHFSFWAIFCPFTPRTAQKVKISKKKKKKKKKKKLWRYYHFT